MSLCDHSPNVVDSLLSDINIISYGINIYIVYQMESLQERMDKYFAEYKTLILNLTILKMETAKIEIADKLVRVGSIQDQSVHADYVHKKICAEGYESVIEMSKHTIKQIPAYKNVRLDSSMVCNIAILILKLEDDHEYKPILLKFHKTLTDRFIANPSPSVRDVFGKRFN